MDIINEPQPGKTRQPALVVIDNEEETLLSIRSLFKRDGYELHLFTSCYEALEFVKYNNVHVLITGMKMPEMTGIELLQRAMEIRSDAIRMIIGGNEEKPKILSAISNGLARHYIMKPLNDEQFQSIVKESMELQQNLRQKKLENILLPFRNLPSPPSLHIKLKKLLVEERVSQKKIAIEIEKSPGLAVNLLKLSNSIFYGVRNPILNVFDALTFIGTESVFNIVLGLETFNCICSDAPQQTMKRIEKIRAKSVIRAQVAREIALRWSRNINMQEAYIAGLLLDIGLIFRLCYSPRESKAFYTEYINNDKPHYSADKEIYNITHDEVGEALLTYWNFPAAIINIVANHHSYTGKDDLTTIVQLAAKLVQGKDSLPYDPYINQFAAEWELKLQDYMETVNDKELFVEN